MLLYIVLVKYLKIKSNSMTLWGTTLWFKRAEIVPITVRMVIRGQKIAHTYDNIYRKNDNISSKGSSTIPSYHNEGLKGYY